MRMLIILWALIFVLSGCGTAFFSAKTEATYTVSKNGKSLTYSSNKEQQNLKADYNVKTGSFNVSVDKAGAQESAVAAAVQQQLIMGELLKELIPLLKAAASKGM